VKVALRSSSFDVSLEVEATPVTISGQTLALHRTVTSPPWVTEGARDVWRVTEPVTGLLIAYGETSGAAVRAAEAKIIYEKAKRGQTIATAVAAKIKEARKKGIKIVK
jgi:hypothetical protein